MSSDKFAPVKLLGLCGSLRAQSSNAEVLHAFAAVNRGDADFQFYGELEQVPPFNPDADTDSPAQVVSGLRARVKAADAVIISTPEYAHGVPGVLKNALDWLVSSGEFVDKPVAILKPSSRGEIAIASLRDTLTVMSARIVESACAALPLTTNRIDRNALVETAETAELLRTSFANLLREIARGSTS